MPFRDLDEDVLLQILPYCDVHTVLHVGRVNKLLRALTLTKEIWLALIHDLAFRGILDLPPADVLRNYTVPDLVDDVKRIVLGPKTWSPASTSPPIITRQRALPAPWATDNSRQTFSGMKVLPGGKYIIWERHSSLLEIRSITRWESVILLVCNTPVPFEVNIIRVKIIRVQLDTGEESGLFEQRLQIRHIWRPIILGNLFLVSVNSGRKDGVLLVNWRGRTHAALECVYDRNLEAILLPEHIIIVSRTAATRDRHIGVYAISSLLFANSFPSNVTDLVFSTGLQPLVSGSPLPDATEAGIPLNLVPSRSLSDAWTPFCIDNAGLEDAVQCFPPYELPATLALGVFWTTGFRVGCSSKAMPHSSSAVKTRLEGTIACLTPALEVLNELHDTSGLPFAPVIASTLASLIVKLQTARRNTEECLKLTQNIHELIYGIIAMHVKSEAGGMLSPTTLYDLAKFTETLHKIHTFVEAQQDGSKIKNFFRQGQMNTLLKECRIGLEQAHEVFKFETGLTTVTSSHQMATRIQLLHDELVELISTLPDTSVSDKASSMYTLELTSIYQVQNQCTFFLRIRKYFMVEKPNSNKSSNAFCLGQQGLLYSDQVEWAKQIFIAADSAPNSLELAAIIGSHLGLKPAMDLTKPVVQHCLRGPSCLLILDNLETPWEPLESRGAVEEFLSLLTDIGHLALIITMRGAERPAKVNWTRPFLQALTPLSAVAARKTFFDIADNFHDSEDIDSLLLLTDNMPLAINLIAHLVNYEGCSSALKRWETEKGALFSEGSDKTSSLHASLEMSMSSPRLGNFPGARHLLSLLSILPDGLWDSDLLQSKLPIQNLLGCKAALRSTSLAYVDNNNRLKCLAPIREYMLLAYPPSPTLVQPLAKHFSLLMELYEENTGIQLKEVTERIHSNFSNLQQMLQQQLVPENPTLAEAIRCAIRFSSFSRVSGHGRTLCMKHLPAILSELGNHSMEALFIIEIFRSGNYYPIPDVQLLVNKGIAQLYHLNDTVLECEFETPFPLELD
ncbi:hypothetical protein C8R43DRAFT_1243567 [Mycena crocata]|nr:hypothetical protein C8R43DRAFT_1243567 [Mycena crocata]